jgi:hypothetical protein
MSSEICEPMAITTRIARAPPMNSRAIRIGIHTSEPALSIAARTEVLQLGLTPVRASLTAVKHAPIATMVTTRLTIPPIAAARTKVRTSADVISEKGFSLVVVSRVSNLSGIVA